MELRQLQSFLVVAWEGRKLMRHVALSRSHRLAGSTEVSPADLDGERLLLYSKAEYPGYWRQVMAYFREHGANAKVAPR